MSEKLPTFIELAEWRLSLMTPREKTCNIKISRGTCRMMVEAEAKQTQYLKRIRAVAKAILAEVCEQGNVDGKISRRTIDRLTQALSGWSDIGEGNMRAGDVCPQVGETWEHQYRGAVKLGSKLGRFSFGVEGSNEPVNDCNLIKRIA